MANKRTKPDAAGGLLDGTRMEDAAEFGDGPVQVALVTRAAGTDLSSFARFPQQHPSIEIDLPPLPKSEIPEDEAAVAIDDVAVNPGALDAATSSVEIMPGDTGDLRDLRTIGALTTGPTPRSSYTTGSLTRDDRSGGRARPARCPRPAAPAAPTTPCSAGPSLRAAPSATTFPARRARCPASTAQARPPVASAVPAPRLRRTSPSRRPC